MEKSKKMKAAVIIDSPRRIVIEDLNIPECKPDEVLVQVKACGLCGSDIHGFMDEESKGRVAGLVMGHEPSGIVAKCGSNVKDWVPGDRIVINPQFFCGECYACKHSWFNICENGGIIGSSLRGFKQGAMAEFVVVPKANLHALPEGLSFEEGAMIEPVANAIHAVNRAGVQIGDCVAVVGAGTIGLCMIQAAKLAGASHVAAIDISDFHLDMARSLGADIVINSSRADPVEEVKKSFRGIGADVTLEAVGVGETYRQASLMTRKRGTLVLFGAAKETALMHLYPFLHRELNMVGCTGFDVEVDIGLQMILEGKMQVKPLITCKYPIEQTEEAIKKAIKDSDNVLKIILVNKN
ncbi:zinc-binding dehydrogenase [uncultured Robinsoniella sp.]|uniref:zinc-dependent alcohol dehydrogenase n=1 Tax=uncultured Robinsoniella sp. TaxID=904190 RepID=UPI00374E8EDC